jgi:uncharacterized phiE125 gp8 family phage protein
MVGILSLADARRQLRLEPDETAEDALIESLIAAAAAYIERRTGWVCPARTDESFVFDGFPGRQVKIPLGPVDPDSVAIAYVDGTGSAAAFTNIRVWEKDGIARVGPAFGWTWPPVACLPGSVTVTADVGVEAATDEADAAVPDDLKHAARLLVGHFFRHREGVAAGDRAAAVEIPFTIDDLLEGERRKRV